MKFCQRCGTAVAEEVIFCPNCGYAIDIGNNVQGHQGYYYGGGGRVEPAHLILSAVMPIYGFCYWFIKRMQDPEKAQVCLKISSVAFLIYFALTFLLLLL